MAPEIFEGKPYGRSVDWWSMGIIVFEMIHGLAPFDVADRGNTKVWDHFLYHSCIFIVMILCEIIYTIRITKSEYLIPV